MSRELDDLKEALLDAALIIDNEGLVKGYGHISARAPGREAMIMTPGRGLGILTDPAEMQLVDFDGNVLEGSGPTNLESALHGRIYRARPDVHAIVRTHGRYGNVLSILGRPARPVHGFGTFLGPEVPVFAEPYLVATPELAREVVAKLGSGHAVLMRGNGQVVVGESIPAATVKAIFLEQSCELQYLALAAGAPQFLTETEIAIRAAPGYDHIGRAWEFYRERLLAELDYED